VLPRRAGENCDAAGVQLNVEPGNEPSAVQFVGMRFDFNNHTVALAKKFIAKLPDLRVVRTTQDFESFMGKLLYGGAVLGVDWAQYLWLIKSYRKILSQLARFPRHAVDLKLPRSAFFQLKKLLSVVRENVPCPVRKPVVRPGGLLDVDAIIASDATIKGFGGVLLRRNHLPEAFGSLWPAPKEINEAETTAAACMLSRFAPSLPRGCSVRLLIDNTSTIHRILNAQRPFCLEKHHIAQRLLDIAEQHGLTLDVQYIASAKNPADAPSRMEEPNTKLMEDVMQSAWGRIGTRTCVGVARAASARDRRMR
jgi:hypothetical protein